MKKISIILVSITFAFILVSGFIMNDDVDFIISKLEKFRNEYPQEKVHLHLDKPFYAVGDDIWFKAYVVNAEEHQLSALSKVLYVDLINEDGALAQSLRIPLAAGLGW